MDIGLGIAGFLSIALAIGHEALGDVWVLKGVKAENLPKTPFGTPALTAATIHATWHIVTVFAFGVGVILLSLARDEGADAKTLLLRVFAAMWLVVALVATGSAVRRMRSPRQLLDLLRLPVPVFFVVVAVLCWNASM